jgi:hypothetical protein
MVRLLVVLGVEARDSWKTMGCVEREAMEEIFA